MEELQWEEEFSNLIKARRGGATYHINVGCNGYGGNGAFLTLGKRRLNLGNFQTVDEAKERCKRHWNAGCDIDHAERY